MRSKDEVAAVDDGLICIARATPPLTARAPRGAQDLFFRLFAVRASRHPRPDDLLTPTGRLRRWADELGGACAAEIRPYASTVARGLAPGSLEALSRLPPEALQMGERPALDRLARRLEGLAGSDPVIVAWSDLWGIWQEGGGGFDSFRIPGVLEAIGWGMEPDPRLRPPAHPAVALFRIPPGAPPERALAPGATAVVALAAPVLRAAGLALPPLPVWVRLLVISGASAADALRLEAHLAFRAAVGMRPGPVRRRLRHLPPERAERLWSVLRDLAEAGGPATPEGLAALHRAGSLLGVAPTEPLGEPEDEGPLRVRG